MESNPCPINTNNGPSPPEYITTLEELILSVVMKEFRKNTIQFQLDFAKKVLEDEDYPDYDMALDYVFDVLGNYEIFNNVPIDDVSDFTDELAKLLEEHEMNPQ